MKDEIQLSKLIVSEFVSIDWDPLLEPERLSGAWAAC